MTPLVFDFLRDHQNYQRKKHRGKSELIAKALGLGKGIETVVDLTAGLAQDAFFVAQLGFHVMAVERVDAVYAALESAYKLALAEEPDNAVLAKLEFFHQDGKEFIKSNPRFLALTKSEVSLYLDPMFPDKKKSALPRKEMQIFRELVGADSDAEALLEQALASGCKRVVVKRSIKAPELRPGVKHRYEGSTIRYDLYSP